jgi:hypothetical protein
VSYQEPKESGKSGGSDCQEVPVEVGSQMLPKKEKQPPRKRRGEAEKLLANQPARPKRRASAKEKVSWLSTRHMY